MKVKTQVRNAKHSYILLIGVFCAAATATASAEAPRFDLSKEKVLYCVGYAHLDTQWRWDFKTTIDRYIHDTLAQNFERFEQFPEYVFNFTGSVRYEMMREYYPDLYERLKGYIAQGRWCVSGSSVDEGDVNVPSPEAIIRQVLYGNEFFRREFGKESVDFMLPDCFGFPASMPSIWAHCGLKGFSTQKLTWGSAVGIPFKVGVWEGLDGKSIIAAFDPGPYVGAIKGRVDTNPEWLARIEQHGTRYGIWADYHYYGVGDQGGAPLEADVRNYIESMNHPDAKIRVALVASDQMFKDITAEQRARLPRYRGDLLLTEHSAGTLTSQSYMKRWNRKNEILADAAERAATASTWLGGTAYPREKLERAWVRVLANQMHDILPGTSIPRAYTYSWNDEIVAMNGFASVLGDAVGSLTRALDTSGEGIPLVVFNALAIEREDPVEATLTFEGKIPGAVRVLDPAGRPVPSQVLKREGQSLKVLFSAKSPPVSWSVFRVIPADEEATAPELAVSERLLENEFYRVEFNDDGDVSSIVDKMAQSRELLAAPAKLVFTHERPQSWPAWNMDWADRSKPPIDAVKGPAKFRIVEEGPVRVALEISRQARNSIIRQTVRLSRGEAGRRIEFDTEIDWQSASCALKASFPLTVANLKATYNWGMGTIERGNNEPTKYEVPAHEWFDLTDSKGEYGVSILDDSKYGSDKPSDHEVRLTLLYSPGVRQSYLDQHSQDWGRHNMVYALYGHAGNWQDAKPEWQARRLNQPLGVWQAPSHGGPLGRAFTFASLSTTQVDIRAIKLAERTDRVIVRLQELEGRDAKGVEIAVGAAITEAEEVDGQERRLAAATLKNGKLLVDFSPYSPRSFAVRLASPPTWLTPPRGEALSLPFDIDVMSRDGAFADGAMDTQGRTLPAEMVPSVIEAEGIAFRMGSGETGKPNALACRGQVLPLPTGDFNRLYVLAASETDTDASFTVGSQVQPRNIPAWTGFVGQWDDRVWDRVFAEVDHRCEGKVTGFRTGFIKREPIAWYATHRHHPERGNEAYQFCYLFKIGLDLPAKAETWRLPDNPQVKILAATLVKHEHDAVRPAAPLYDDFTGRAPLVLRHVYPPPPKPVHEGLSPTARVVADRKPAFAELSMGPPRTDDAIDQSRGRDLVFRYFDGQGDYRPHSGSGVKGDSLPRLNDGAAAENDDDTRRCVWYDNEGRFHLDLKSSTAIKAIHVYSWHRDDRAPQRYSLWGSNKPEMPNPGIQHGSPGDWSLIAVVNTKPLGNGGVHGSGILPRDGESALGPYRHLLWIADDVGHGTFFTEIDLDAAP